MKDEQKKHELFMHKAFQLAEQAREEGEIPVGAVVVHNNIIIGKGYNQTERLNDATAHAEMIAITAAAEYLNSKYLKNCTLYITLEPCLMCGGAATWSQVPHIIYGAADPQKGCFSNNMHLMPKKTIVQGGVLEEICKEIVLQFFEEKRTF